MSSRDRLITNFCTFTFYGFLSYGFFYFSYKYYTPNFGGTDFLEEYYRMYLQPLRFDVASAPFIYRQLSAILVHLVWLSGIYHGTDIAFAEPGYDQRVFFAAMLTNYAALVATATVAADIARKLMPGKNEAWALMGGAFCFFDFYSQPAAMSVTTEGVSWLIVAIGFLGYVRRSPLTVGIVLCLAIFQREIVPIIFAALSASLIVLGSKDRKFHATILMLSVAAFGLYAAMRTFWIPVAGYEEQLSLSSFVQLLSQWSRLLSANAIFQVFLSQNLLIVLGALSVWSVIGRPGNGKASDAATDPLTGGLYMTALLLTVVGVGTLLQSNNIGRILSLLTPIASPILAMLLARIFHDRSAYGESVT